MFLVRLIDVFVGILEFVFKSDKRGQGASPAVLGTAGILTLVVLVLVAIGIPRISYHVKTSPYSAELANAGGLITSDPVLVAGVPAGRIESIELAGDRVRVGFRLDNVQPLGDQTRATVRLRTVLGKRYFEVIPAGSGQVGENNTIPLSRTDSPYTLDDISSDAVDSSAEVDPQVVRSMMTTLRALVPDSDELSGAMDGVGGAALAVSGTGAQLDQLLRVAKRLADVTASQADSLSNAMGSTQAIVQTLVVRKVVLTRLVDNLRLVLSTMAETFPTVPMGELVTNVAAVTGTLKSNVDQIDQLLKKLPPAMRTITDATGNGNWADVSSPSAVIPDGMLCVLGVMTGCR
ncbi:MlaD family protein [Gordonia alkaliphila]|uniref:MlaD family protein n=1 Tax=Gordonia alkaliphila TaxID=1053547 RepID=UPI001FF5C81E|nr:MlaD family protein [Gordonia alkaliphila]MCK0439781.1 MlaD family protein [Gordonia alkaliphila]